MVAGHGRVLALRAMRDAGQTPPAGVRIDASGGWLLPMLVGWSSRSDAEAEAYLVADNEWSFRGGWDDQALANLLQDLIDADPDLLAVTGFQQADLEALLVSAAADVGGSADEMPSDDVPPPPVNPVTRLGDIWQLGRHRLICGDARDTEVYSKLLNGDLANLVLTSPPYATQRKYDETSGFKPIKPEAYVDWFEAVQANIWGGLADDGSWLLNIKEHSGDGGQRQLYVKDLVLAHVRRWSWFFVDELCWVDTKNGVPGHWPNRFKDAWEPVFHFSKQAAIKFDALANGTASVDVFDYSPNTASASSGSGLLGQKGTTVYEGVARPSNVLHIAAGGDGTHSAQFPIALPTWFIRAFCSRGDIVLDPFAGSGTTLMAAHHEGRVGYAIEISPAYCDLSCARYEKHTGTVPVLEATGKPHSFIEAAHNADAA
jgi:DNA modification methylase